MHIGQVKGTKGKCKKGKKGTVSRKETRGQTTPILFGSAGIVASGDTRKLSVEAEEGPRVKPPAATVQAVATVNQFHSSDGRDDSFWMFAVSASSGRNVRVLVDSGADKHVCPMSFASATPLGATKGGMLYANCRKLIAV